MSIHIVEQKLAAMGLSLPVLPGTPGIYKRCVQTGQYLYVSGHVSVTADGNYITGKAGFDMDIEAAKIAARQAGLAILTSIKQHTGSLDAIKRVIKLLGMVNSTPDFEKHPVVINGCSELYAQLWGEENGIGVRSAVGMSSLPGNAAVEIEALFELALI
jgi:enamine deaminase RidA (YjgF/YER057c/UK114 family)